MFVERTSNGGTEFEFVFVLFVNVRYGETFCQLSEKISLYLIDEWVSE